MPQALALGSQHHIYAENSIAGIATDVSDAFTVGFIHVNARLRQRGQYTAPVAQHSGRLDVQVQEHKPRRAPRIRHENAWGKEWGGGM